MYIGKGASKSVAAAIFNWLLRQANHIAWAESTLLARHRLFAAGMLVVAKPCERI